MLVYIVVLHIPCGSQLISQLNRFVFLIFICWVSSCRTYWGANRTKSELEIHIFYRVFPFIWNVISVEHSGQWAMGMQGRSPVKEPVPRIRATSQIRPHQKSRSHLKRYKSSQDHAIVIDEKEKFKILFSSFKRKKMNRKFLSPVSRGTIEILKNILNFREEKE